MNFSILILISIFQLASAKPFWLSAKIESIQFKDGCLKNALCSQPRLQLIQEISPLSEQTSISWPLSETTDGNKLQPFVSFFPSGLLEDVSLSASVVGVDRAYGFPRICDQSSAVHVFDEQMTVVDEFQIEETSKTIEIKAKCVIVTITVTKHLERCPWCPSPSTDFSADELSENPETLVSKMQTFLTSFGTSSEENLQTIVKVLAIFSIFALISFSIVLVLHLRDRNQHNSLTNIPLPMEKENDAEYATICDYENLPRDRSLSYWSSSSTTSSEATQFNIGISDPMYTLV